MPESTIQFTHVSLGLMIGVLIGLGGFVLVPLIVDQPDPWLRWGILLWYPTLGGMIGVLVRDGPALWHRWMVGSAVGGWLNAVLTFFAHDQMRRFMETVFGQDSAFTSPFWFVLEGAAVGAVIGLVIDRFAAD